MASNAVLVPDERKSEPIGRARLGLLLALCVVAAWPATLLAQAPAAPHAPAAPQAPAPAAEKADPSRLFPPDAVSQHALAQGDKRLAYTTTAGSLPLLGPKGEVSARIFSVAYTLDEKAADRPITFVFNGGPGAASAFLHLGAMGPRAVNFSANGAAALQPVALADNPDAWLDFTDLVFVDPVATGYSRSAAGTEEADKAFFGVEKDADAMADFVRLTLTRAGRTLSPVFLAGESYGGFRVALLAHRLDRQRHRRERRGDDLARARILPAAQQPPMRCSPWRWCCPRSRPRIWSAATVRRLPRYSAGSRALRALGLSRAPGGGPQERRRDRPHARALHRAGAGRDPRSPEPGLDAHLHARVREGRRARAQPL